MPSMISSKGRYGLRIMIELATHDGWVSLGEIAKRQGISRKYLDRIVSQLTKAHFVEGQRGKGGGYRLVREPHTYTLGGIIRAAEGTTLAPVACLDCMSISLCPRAKTCKSLPVWLELGNLISDFLDSKTLDDIISPSEISNNK